MRKIIQLIGVTLVLSLVLSMAPMAMANGADAKGGAKLSFGQSSYKGVIGFPFKVELEVSQSIGETLPNDLYFAIKKEQQKYATVNKDTGVVTPLSPGTLYVYALSPSQGSAATIRCKVQISHNLYDSWKVSKSGAGSFILSPKRVYRYNGKTIGEINVYNKGYSGGISRLYVSSGNLSMILSDDAGSGGSVVVASAIVGKEKKFSSPISKGKTGVIKVEFKQAKANLNFTTGRYSIDLIGNIRASGGY